MTAGVSGAVLRAESPPPPADVDFRIIVTGSRHITADQGVYVTKVLYLATLRPLALGRRVVIVQGKCPNGVDLVAASWAKLARLDGEDFPADWKGLGKAAGPARNQQMVDAGGSICLAFPAADSTGTWDCVRKASLAGIHTRIYPLTEEPQKS